MDQTTILNVLDRLAAVSTYNSMEEWQADVLKVVSEHMRADRSAFIWKPYNSAPKAVQRNIPASRMNEYMERFYALDPLVFITDHGSGLALNRGPKYRKTIVNLEDVVDRATLEKSEYYNDFLKPQRILHETIVYLACVQKKVPLGILSMMRHNSRNFSHTKHNFLKVLTPYLTTCINYFTLRQTNRINDLVLNLPEAQSSNGIILLNMDMQVLYINAKAEELLAQLDDIPPASIIEECRILRKKIAVAAPAVPDALTSCKLHLGSRSLNVLIRQISADTHQRSDENLFVVSIESSTPSRFSRQKIQTYLSLTRRESEIVESIFKGQSNAQIAEELFISEITVKKHIHNILRKTGLKSRTAIINRILKAFNIF